MVEHQEPHQELFEPHLILPVGTQVVTRIVIRSAAGEVLHPKGAVGVIVENLTDEIQKYQIRFPSGGESVMKRQDFAVRKQLREVTIQRMNTPNYDELYNHVQYRCVIGSRAYELDNEDSDTDRRGFYLAPADLQWSMSGAPEQIENDDTQEVYWELQKFLTLALKANPNVLECLYTPMVEYVSPLAQELIAMREIFLSKFIYQTYNGYVLSQFKKLEMDLRTKGEPRWKHAMHLIRLLISGITVLREGFVMVGVGQYRDQLLSIKRAEMSWVDLNVWRLALHREFDQAYNESKLPELPKFEKADEFLIRARRSAVK